MTEMANIGHFVEKLRLPFPTPLHSPLMPPFEKTKMVQLFGSSPSMMLGRAGFRPL